MNKKNAFTMLVLLSLLLTQLAFAPAQPALAAACDAAQFVADITVLDGTSFKAGDPFDKTWRLKNVGSCSWSASYNLVFDSGDRMGAPASIPLPASVAPGQSIDLTAKMTAPNVSGLVRGNWKLKNAAGVLFGIGSTADKAFWVEIRVSSSGGGGAGYDFVQNAASATWTSGAGTLPFPGTAGDANGAGLKLDNPKLENGSSAGTPGLLMTPQNAYNGFVQAQYPAYRVQSGDHFKSIINCDYNATSCYVNFRLDYQIGTGPVNTFWTFNERYEGLYYSADRDISSLAGQDVKFILRVGAAGYATGDRAVWAAPRISGGGTPPTTVPTITGTPPTPTLTPIPSSGCDRATFVSDLDVPDGKVFAPNTAFTKTWQIKNTGTCTWTTDYKLVFVSGELMGAAANEINLVSTIAPNTTVNISVTLKSPGTNGSYRGYWQFKNKAGALFGIGSTADKPFWVDITVAGGTTTTATPTVTGTPPTPTPTVSGPTKTPTPNAGPDRAIFISESVPDGSAYGPSTAFRKTWRIKNTGTSTWGAGYKLVFASGSQMSGPNEAPLPSSVAPNGIIDISVDLISPAANGTYRGYWQLKNASGGFFGIGSTANRPFWVDILVTGTVSATATPTTGPAPTVTATLQPSGAYSVVDITKEDGTLNVRSAAGATNPLTGSLAYNATNIGKLGSPVMVGTAEWWQVQKSTTTGWVNAFYLTEYVPAATFCADTKVTTLLTNLGTALKNADGAALAPLVSPKHGVDIRLVSNNTPVNYTQATAASIFTSTTVQTWGPAAASGQIISGPFKDIIQPKLLDVYNSSYQLSCNDTSKVGPVDQPWPSEYTTINFFSIYKPPSASGGLDWRDFLVGIEYLNGQPYLFSLVHFEWVP